MSYKNFLIIVFIIFSCIFIFSTTQIFAKDAQTQFKEGLGKTGVGSGYVKTGETEKFTKFPEYIGLIIQAFLGLLGVIFVVLIIYGGYIWMTARGNEQRVEKAKETLKAAIIGLVIVLSAYAITYFIGSQLKDAGAPPTEEASATAS